MEKQQIIIVYDVPGTGDIMMSRISRISPLLELTAS